MGDDHHRHPIGLEDLERAQQRLLAFVVEVGIGLVEDDQPRLAVERAGKRDALPLPGRKRLPGVADLGVVALGQPQDELVHMRALRGTHHFRGVRRAEARDVLRHGAAEQLHVLRQVAEVWPQIFARPRGHVGAIQPHHARRRLPYADDEARQRRLARSARTDQAERLSRRQLEGNAAQDDFVAQPEGYAFELDSAFRRRKLRAGVRRRVGAQQVVQAPPGIPRLDQAAPAGDQRLDRRQGAAERMVAAIITPAVTSCETTRRAPTPSMASWMN